MARAPDPTPIRTSPVTQLSTPAHHRPADGPMKGLRPVLSHEQMALVMAGAGWAFALGVFVGVFVVTLIFGSKINDIAYTMVERVMEQAAYRDSLSRTMP